MKEGTRHKSQKWNEKKEEKQRKGNSKWEVHVWVLGRESKRWKISCDGVYALQHFLFFHCCQKDVKKEMLFFLFSLFFIFFYSSIIVQLIAKSFFLFCFFMCVGAHVNCFGLCTLFLALSPLPKRIYLSIIYEIEN